MTKTLFIVRIVFVTTIHHNFPELLNNKLQNMIYRHIQSNITDPLARPLGTEIISSNIACDFYIPNLYRWAYIFQVWRGCVGRGGGGVSR